jgi:hypothetical protein
MNKKLLDLMKVKCKDMGLSEKAIEDLVTTGSEGLTDESSQEDIEARANLILPYAKAMQSEGTRWAQAAKEKADPTKKEEPKTPPTGDEKPWETAIKTLEEKYGTELLNLKKENETFKAEKIQSERASLISQAQKKHGISDDDMKFVSIPADADVETFFTDYKQHLITKGLMSAEAAGIQATTEQASEEFAKTLLNEIEVKP